MRYRAAPHRGIRKQFHYFSLEATYLWCLIPGHSREVNGPRVKSAWSVPGTSPDWRLFPVRDRIPGKQRYPRLRSVACPENAGRKASTARDIQAATALDEAGSERLVRTFYETACQDAVIGHLFDGVGDRSNRRAAHQQTTSQLRLNDEPVSPEGSVTCGHPDPTFVAPGPSCMMGALRVWRNGRRSRLKIDRRKAWGFESPLSHQRPAAPRCRVGRGRTGRSPRGTPCSR
jgi:hypothetical protein